MLEQATRLIYFKIALDTLVTHRSLRSLRLAGFALCAVGANSLLGVMYPEIPTEMLIRVTRDPQRPACRAGSFWGVKSGRFGMASEITSGSRQYYSPNLSKSAYENRYFRRWRQRS